MTQFSEPTFQDGNVGPSFLSLLGLVVVLVMAGVSLAVFLAAG
jgi:hypothetical protein